MAEENLIDDEVESTEVEEAPPSPEEIRAAEEELLRRAIAAKIQVSKKTSTIEPNDEYFVLDFPAGRDTRRVSVFRRPERLQAILSTPFENYIFLSGYNALCSYKDRTIEAAIRLLQPGASRLKALKGLTLDPPVPGVLPKIVIGEPSPAFTAIRGRMVNSSMTVTLEDVAVTQHDAAVDLLERVANALFFQIEMLSSLSLTLDRDRRPRLLRRSTREADIRNVVTYPSMEYEKAPMSLYWYARSAAGMPLLQFLAFYQVIEFYFPTYSQAEARRTLRAILKDPTFRSDKESDLARLVTAIYVNRAGGVGDERSQLKSSIKECVDAQAMRDFLTEQDDRKKFFSSKSKLTDRKLSIDNETLDLRDEVADRVYAIRCKIVHTKNDGRDGEIALLLPFSEEASLLEHDIQLLEFLAQRVLITASTPLNR